MDPKKAVALKYPPRGSYLIELSQAVCSRRFLRFTALSVAMLPGAAAHPVPCLSGRRP